MYNPNSWPSWVFVDNPGLLWQFKQVSLPIDISTGNGVDDGLVDTGAVGVGGAAVAWNITSPIAAGFALPGMVDCARTIAADFHNIAAIASATSQNKTHAAA